MNIESGNTFFRLFRIQYIGDCVTTNVTKMALMTDPFNRREHTDGKQDVCDVELRHVHITKMKTKAIIDYWGGRRIHKLLCPCQLWSSLHPGAMWYSHENAFVCCCTGGEFVCNEGASVCALKLRLF